MTRAQAVLERDFAGWLTACATRLGWRWWHVPAPMRAASGGRGWVGAREARGLPDYVFMHEDPPRLLFVETKGDRGELTDEQREFLALAHAIGVRCRDPLEPDGRGQTAQVVAAVCWRPGDEAVAESTLRSRVLS